jgi:signal transduction histidine kinase
MKLGPRVAIVTTLLMACVFAVAATAALRIRRADLERDLDRSARELAEVLAAGLEPLTPATAHQALQSRLAWALENDGSFMLETLVAGDYRTADSTWAGLVKAARLAGAPVGKFFFDVPKGRRPVYAMAIPLHDARPGNEARQPVAFLGLKRDCGYIDEEVWASAWRILPFLLLGVLAFGGLVYLFLVSRVVTPLRRLIDAIDAVSKGDLSRALLPEQEDEIGSLAARFNAMTNYLRDAREEEARANAARLSLETRLRHSEKLATMGQMAAEIAHEVGTPLNVIGGRARSITRRAQEPAEVQKNAEIITTQVERITRIIRQVLHFSRKTRPTLTQVDLHKVVFEALEFVDEALKRQRIEVVVTGSSDVPSIPGNPEEIQQVCLNLITNALQAMPTGGRLTVALDRVTRRKEGLALAPPAPYLMLEVSDSGTGIPPSNREKIFEAFFTTKDTGEGTGLGLAVSKGIVKDHDGWIEVDDCPQGGAVFRVFLPVAMPVDENEEAPEASASGSG